MKLHETPVLKWFASLRLAVVFAVLTLLMMLASTIVALYLGRELRMNRNQVEMIAQIEAQVDSLPRAINDANIGIPDGVTRLDKSKNILDELATLLREGEANQIPALDINRYPDGDAALMAWDGLRPLIQTMLDNQDTLLARQVEYAVVRQNLESVERQLSMLRDLVPTTQASGALLALYDSAVKAEAALTDLIRFSTAAIDNRRTQFAFGNYESAVQAWRETLSRTLSLEPPRFLALGESLGLSQQISDLAAAARAYDEALGKVLDRKDAIAVLQDTFASISFAQQGLRSSVGGLRSQVVEYGVLTGRYQLISNLLGLASVVFLILTGLALTLHSRRRLDETRDINQRNQQAILRLLDEMLGLADGDLTRYATVTEDITGAIADSLNYTVDALRDLVSTINRTAEQVGQGASDSQNASLQLADEAQRQASDIHEMNEAITTVARMIQGVAREAEESRTLAESAVSTASRGAATVRQAITGMDTIREQIQETSKRIKRLGESSQEIGDIVGLINDIADQTNILALNAAIQASMAGEAGRGFAVVADEVQRLAERVANATKQIESLVKTIQADTNDAIISMEQSTANVVEGANLAQRAGEALTEIETASTSLASRVERIAQEASEQRRLAESVRENMTRVGESTAQTANAATGSARAIDRLSQLARELRESVAGFKLPE